MLPLQLLVSITEKFEMSIAAPTFQQAEAIIIYTTEFEPIDQEIGYCKAGTIHNLSEV